MSAEITVVAKTDVDSISELKDICWGQALTVLDEIEEAGKEDELFYYLADMNETWEDVELNDLLAYDWESVYEAIGMKDDEEEEEEEEEEKDFVYIKKFPAWAVYYAASGESDGLNEEDIEMVDKFMKNNNLGSLVDTIEDSYNEFESFPAFGGGSDTYTAIFRKRN